MQADVHRIRRGNFTTDINWYVPQNTPNVSQKKIILEETVSRSATKTAYNERSAHRNVLTTETKWSSELGVDKWIDVPFYVLVGFMQRKQFHQQTRNIDTIYQTIVTNARCVIVREKYTEIGMICDCGHGKIFHVYGEVVFCFRPWTKKHSLNIFYRKRI